MRLTVRAHLLLIVLLGAILPLALLGGWLARSSVRSGEDLLLAQLDSSLHNVARSIAARWEYRRGDLLFLADNEVAHRLAAGAVLQRADSVFLDDVAAQLRGSIPSFRYTDAAGGAVYASPAGDRQPDAPGQRGAGVARPTLRVEYPIATAGEQGRLEAQVYLDAIFPADSARLLLAGSYYAVRDRATSAVLRPLSAELDFPEGPRFPVAGESWRSRATSIAEPAFDIAVAAPLAPFVQPFERAARLGFAALVVIALIAMLLTTALTHRLAAAVQALDSAAHAVAGGDLSREAATAGPLELQRLAHSFNAMTAGLRRLVAEAAERRALAAVGEFASELSHEVRNALTAVQLDLERVEERAESEKNRLLLARSLTHVRRLDAAVTGSLRVARSGRIEPRELDLPEVLREAVETARPSFAAAGSSLATGSIEADVLVRGDRDALLQLFLNLLFNAQQALPEGGTAIASLSVAQDTATASISDDGPGMTATELARAQEPFFTTRERGTGLGLPIARQIAVAHGGEIYMVSTPGRGTTVEVRIPMAGRRVAAGRQWG